MYAGRHPFACARLTPTEPGEALIASRPSPLTSSNPPGTANRRMPMNRPAGITSMEFA
ncbi:MAG: hypothetical protein KDC23_09065 [Actinobacteria bacterium]|nr:hypothetical protein [Actinomycetota bacterium]